MQDANSFTRAWIKLYTSPLQAVLEAEAVEIGETIDELAEAPGSRRLRITAYASFDLTGRARLADLLGKGFQPV